MDEIIAEEVKKRCHKNEHELDRGCGRGEREDRGYFHIEIVMRDPTAKRTKATPRARACEYATTSARRRVEVESMKKRIRSKKKTVHREPSFSRHFLLMPATGA